MIHSFVHLLSFATRELYSLLLRALKSAHNSNMWAPVAAGRYSAVMLDVKPYHVALSILSGLIKAPPMLQIMMGGFSFLLLQKSEGHTSPTRWTAK